MYYLLLLLLYDNGSNGYNQNIINHPYSWTRLEMEKKIWLKIKPNSIIVVYDIYIIQIKYLYIMLYGIRLLLAFYNCIL